VKSTDAKMAPTASSSPTAGLAPLLTPHGRLRLVPTDDAQPLPADLRRRLAEAFERGAGHGLLQLGAGEVATALPAVLAYWRELGTLFVTALCTTAADVEGPARAPLPAPPTKELQALAAAPPPR